MSQQVYHFIREEIKFWLSNSNAINIFMRDVWATFSFHIKIGKIIFVIITIRRIENVKKISNWFFLKALATCANNSNKLKIGILRSTNLERFFCVCHHQILGFKIPSKRNFFWHPNKLKSSSCLYSSNVLNLSIALKFNFNWKEIIFPEGRSWLWLKMSSICVIFK